MGNSIDLRNGTLSSYTSHPNMARLNCIAIHNNYRQHSYIDDT